MRLLDLESFLIRPVQRISQYHLHVKSILKYTDELHPDYDYLAMSYSKSEAVGIAVDRRSEDLKMSMALCQVSEMIDWSKVLKNPKFQLITFTTLLGPRRLVKMGPLLVCTSQRPLFRRHIQAFLFNDVAMFVEMNEDPVPFSNETPSKLPYDSSNVEGSGLSRNQNAMVRSPIETCDILVLPTKEDSTRFLCSRSSDGTRLIMLDDKSTWSLKADSESQDQEWAKAFREASDAHYQALYAAISAGYTIGKHTSLIDPVQRQMILDGKHPKWMKSLHHHSYPRF